MLASTPVRSFGRRSTRNRNVRDGFAGGNVRVRESYARPDVPVPRLILEGQDDLVIIPTASALDTHLDTLLSCGRLASQAVILGSVVNRLRAQGYSRTLAKLRQAVLMDANRVWSGFADEHSKEILAPRNTTNALVYLGSWTSLTLVVLSENEDFRQTLSALCPTLIVCSTFDFVQDWGHPSNGFLSESDYTNALSIAESSMRRASLISTISRPPSTDDISGLIGSGQRIRGKLKCIGPKLAYVGDMLIPSSDFRRKAIHGDTVEVAPLRPAMDVSTAVTEGDITKESVKGHVVVSILKRAAYRNLVVTLDAKEFEHYSSDASSLHDALRRVLCVPMDDRFPKIGVLTRLGASLIGKRFVVSITDWPSDSTFPQGKYLRTVGSALDLATESSCILIESDLEDHEKPFPLSAMRELPRHDEITFEPGSKGAVDFRDRQVISIDPIGCQDIDDAISVEQQVDGSFELAVHIADVARYVESGSNLDKEAFSRSTSVYMQERRLDMLPSLLCEDLCSLRPRVERFALSCIFHVRSDFSVDLESARFRRTLIRSRYALAYEQAQSLADGKAPGDFLNGTGRGWTGGVVERADHDWIRESIRLLMEIARRRDKERKARGAVSLEAEGEYKFALNSELKPVRVASSHHLEIHETIAELMILANEAAAKLTFQKAPMRALLRHHPPADVTRFKACIELCERLGFAFDASSNRAVSLSLQTIRDNCTDIASIKLVEQLATRAMSEAQYICSGTSRTEMGGQSPFYHFGLGLDFYTHFTSPIRRYADIIVARLLLEDSTENQIKSNRENFLELENDKAETQKNLLVVQQKQNDEFGEDESSTTENIARAPESKKIVTNLGAASAEDPQTDAWAEMLTGQSNHEGYSWANALMGDSDSAADSWADALKGDNDESEQNTWLQGLSDIVSQGPSMMKGSTPLKEELQSSNVAVESPHKPPPSYLEYSAMFNWIIPSLAKAELDSTSKILSVDSNSSVSGIHWHVSTQAVQDACDHINRRHRCAKDASSKSQDMFFSLYFSENPQQTIGVVLEVMHSAIICFVQEYDLKVRIPLLLRDGATNVNAFISMDDSQPGNVGPVSIDEKNASVTIIVRRSDGNVVPVNLKKLCRVPIKLSCTVKEEGAAPSPRLAPILGQIRYHSLFEQPSLDFSHTQTQQQAQNKIVVKRSVLDKSQRIPTSESAKAIPKRGSLYCTIENSLIRPSKEHAKVQITAGNSRGSSFVMKRLCFGGFVQKKPFADLRRSFEEDDDDGGTYHAGSGYPSQSASGMGANQIKRMEKAALARVAKLQAEKYDSRVKRRMKKD